MGYSVPAAVGAKIAFPERMVVSLVGDGGFLMTGQEIATAFHHGVAPIVLVFNNQMYGTIRMHQERAYPWRVSGTALTNPDFAKYIEAFGGHGEVVSETGEFAPAFRRAVESGRPALIELRVNPEQITTRQTIAQLRAGKAPPKPAAKPKRAAAQKHPKPARHRRPAWASRGAERRGLHAVPAVHAVSHRRHRDDACRMPRSPTSPWRRGITGRATFRPRRAPATQFSSMQPRHFDALHLRGVLHLEQQRPEEALDVPAAARSNSGRMIRNCSSISATRCWRCSATTWRWPRFAGRSPCALAISMR